MVQGVKTLGLGRARLETDWNLNKGSGSYRTLRVFKRATFVLWKGHFIRERQTNSLFLGFQNLTIWNLEILRQKGAVAQLVER